MESPTEAVNRSIDGRLRSVLSDGFLEMPAEDPFLFLLAVAPAFRSVRAGVASSCGFLSELADPPEDLLLCRFTAWPLVVEAGSSPDLELLLGWREGDGDLDVRFFLRLNRSANAPATERGFCGRSTGFGGSLPFGGASTFSGVSSVGRVN